MRINPAISASVISRYEKAVRRQTAEGQGLSTADKVELSEQALLFSSLIQSAKNCEDFDGAKVTAIKNKIASGSYHVDVAGLARKMIGMAGGGE